MIKVVKYTAQGSLDVDSSQDRDDLTLPSFYHLGKKFGI